MSGRVWPPALEPEGAAVWVTRLQSEFPMASVWYGEHTRQWCAVVRGVDQLLEAGDPASLRRLLQASSAPSGGSWVVGR